MRPATALSPVVLSTSQMLATPVIPKVPAHKRQTCCSNAGARRAPIAHPQRCVWARDKLGDTLVSSSVQGFRDYFIAMFLRRLGHLQQHKLGGSLPRFQQAQTERVSTSDDFWIIFPLLPVA